MVCRVKNAWGMCLLAVVVISGCQSDPPQASPPASAQASPDAAAAAQGSADPPPPAAPPAPPAKAPAPAPIPSAKDPPSARTGQDPAPVPANAVKAPTFVPLLPLVRPPVDNSRCHVCHLNYSEEELAVSHTQFGVGCETCHGASDDHCGDEGNVTAPGILYGRSTINGACQRCHPHRWVWDGGRYCDYVFVPPDPPLVCTDCHGSHRLARRSVRWDKVTGKLIRE